VPTQHSADVPFDLNSTSRQGGRVACRVDVGRHAYCGNVPPQRNLTWTKADFDL